MNKWRSNDYRMYLLVYLSSLYNRGHIDDLLSVDIIYSSQQYLIIGLLQFLSVVLYSVILLTYHFLS